MRQIQEAFGLTILSPKLIPGFVKAKKRDSPDLVIWFNQKVLRDETDTTVVHFGDGVTARLNPALSEIHIQYSSGSSFEDICAYLQGPLLGLFARLQGKRVLHACSVLLANGVSAFAGDAGYGKSTLAAVWALSGHSVLSDDVCVCLENADQVCVPPGCFHIRLWPESVKLLFGRTDALPLIAPPWPKRYLDLVGLGQFQAESAPLGVIYVMELAQDKNTDVSIMRLHGHAALMALVKNSYGIHRLSAAQRADELKRMAALVDQVPVYRLLVPQTSDRAFRIRDAILRRHV